MENRLSLRLLPGFLLITSAAGCMGFAQNSANLQLSQNRTVAARDYLVRVMQMAPTRSHHQYLTGTAITPLQKKTVHQKARCVGRWLIGFPY